MKKAIIIMAKVPEAGNVKTRLQTVLSPADCAGLAACLLTDTIEKAAQMQHQLIIAYLPRERRDFFDDLSVHNFTLIPQKGADLGEKMFNAFRFACPPDSDSAAVMIGTDSPTFPAGFIEKAFSFLDKDAEAVLGETEDGGFYLIGLRTLRKEIFANVDWSSPQTFRQTVRNMTGLGLNPAFLPKWFDVDRPADLKRLKNDLTENPGLAPQTARWFAAGR